MKLRIMPFYLQMLCVSDKHTIIGKQLNNKKAKNNLLIYSYLLGETLTSDQTDRQ